MSKRDEIINAFKALIEDSSETITPSIIAKKAKISRATFYNYYDSYKDLLQDCYKDLTTAFADLNSFTLNSFLNFFRENRNFFVVYLDACPFSNLLSDYLGPQKYGDINSIDIDIDSRYQAAYEISGINGILFTWAIDECTTPVRIIRRAILANQDIKEYPASNRFILCDVEIYSEASDRDYTLVYLSTNPHLSAGDEVCVPLGQNNNLVQGIVTNVRIVEEKDLPLPLYKIKYIADYY
jgi:AcrR family transcriptional regulator